MTTRENWRTGIITLAAAIVWLLSSVTTHAQAPASIQATRRRPTAYFAREPWRAYWLDMATRTPIIREIAHNTNQAHGNVWDEYVISWHDNVQTESDTQPVFNAMLAQLTESLPRDGFAPDYHGYLVAHANGTLDAWTLATIRDAMSESVFCQPNDALFDQIMLDTVIQRMAERDIAEYGSEPMPESHFVEYWRDLFQADELPNQSDYAAFCQIMHQTAKTVTR